MSHSELLSLSLSLSTTRSTRNRLQTYAHTHTLAHRFCFCTVDSVWPNFYLPACQVSSSSSSSTWGAHWSVADSFEAQLNERERSSQTTSHESHWPRVHKQKQNQGTYRVESVCVYFSSSIARLLAPSVSVWVWVECSLVVWVELSRRRGPIMTVVARIALLLWPMAQLTLTLEVDWVDCLTACLFVPACTVPVPIDCTVYSERTPFFWSFCLPA